MHIDLAKSSGFCFGVKRALQIARHTAAAKQRVYMLGDIVHNEEVAGQIRKAGIKRLRQLSRREKGILLIRAHGACRQTLAKAKRLGYTIVDATCPMVKEIHRIARQWEKKGYRIIVIGDKRHDEVEGIIGQLHTKAVIIDRANEIPRALIQKINKAAVVVQSTHNVEQVQKIVATLRRYIKEVKFFNTICRPTQTKQAEIKLISRRNQVMVIIGSRSSANTKRLYQIARSINRRTHWVQANTDLKPQWFQKTKSVGIMAGASTPDSTTNEVVRKILTFRCRLTFDKVGQ